MREYMPTTHADPETIRAYAAGDASFDDIAEDRGPKIMTTLDLPFGQINDRGQQVKARKLTAGEKARKTKLEEDSRVYEAQLRNLTRGADDENRTDREAHLSGMAGPRPVRTVADGRFV